MATVNKQVFYDELGCKVDELAERLNQIECRLNESGQKKNPEYYKVQRDIRVLLILREVVSQVDKDDIELKGQVATWYHDGIFTTKVEKGSLDADNSIKVGANILELMESHQDVKNFMTKLQKYCEKKEWKLNFTTGKIEY